MKIAPYQIENYLTKIASEKIAGALIFGPETSLVSARFEIAAKKITPDLSDPFLVVHLNKERFALEPSCLADEFYSFSMLGGRKLILVKEPDAAVTSSLKALLLSPKEEISKSENFILIQGGDLDKSSALRKIAEENQAFAAIACYEDDDNSIKKIIESELAKNSIEANKDIVEYIFEKLGKNRQIIASEINKIAIYLDGEDINTNLIDKAIGQQAEISSDEFINNFIEKNYKKADEQAIYLFKHGFEVIMLSRFLANYLQKLYHAKMAIEVEKSTIDAAIESQKLFFKTKISFKKNLQSTSLNTLKHWLVELQNLELKIKTDSSIPPKLLFANFLQTELR